MSAPSNKPWIRIVSDGMGTPSRIYALDKNGQETELRCTSADIRLRMGEPVTATLGVMVVGGRVDAELDKLIVHHAGVSRLRALWWKVRRVWWAVWFDPVPRAIRKPR